jgi:outer membrane protein TolC
MTARRGGRVRRGGVRRVAAAWLALATAGCVRYVPQPIDPSVHAAAYRARRLDDSAVVAWVGRYGPAPQPGRWSARQLAVAALGTRADVARARADWRAARQGERRAGARPQPGVQTDVERAVSGDGGESPWVVSLAATLSVELGGKRGARLAQARARTAAVESDLRATAWGSILAVRDAVLTLMGAAQDLVLARTEVELLAGVDSLERARFNEGSLSGAEVARTRAEVQDAVVRSRSAETAALEARAVLAGVLAMPAQALESVTVVGGSGDCARADSVGSDSLAALALLHRPEIGRTLAEYAGAEADLRLEVARQFPELDVGPGFIWDLGVHRWTLALALPNLLGFRNRGPIEEAVGLRAAAAARLMEAQDAILAEVDVAVARCRGTERERAAAVAQVSAADQAAKLARDAYGRGETSRLEPALAELAVARASRARWGAEARRWRADVALERALGEWADEPGQRWPDPREPGLTEGALP